MMLDKRHRAIYFFTIAVLPCPSRPKHFVRTLAMDADHPTSRYTRAEEIANSLTHGIGTVLAIAGLAVLTDFAAVYGDGWHIVSSAVFGAA